MLLCSTHETLINISWNKTSGSNSSRHSDKRFIIPNFFAWVKSQITVTWLLDFPSKWKIVANGVAKIQKISPDESWSFSSTKENPADCASQLKTADLVQR